MRKLGLFGEKVLLTEQGPGEQGIPRQTRVAVPARLAAFPVLAPPLAQPAVCQGLVGKAANQGRAAQEECRAQVAALLP